MHHLLLDASVTNQLVVWATHVIRSLGYSGVGLLILCSAVIAVPGTEATMLFAGFNVYQHHLTLLGIIIAGVVGDVVGATLAWMIGRFGLAELLARIGGPLHVGPHGLDRANRWFERYGEIVIPLSRLAPVVRCAFPYAAGVGEMPLWRLIPLATVGSVVWIGGLAIAGRAVGSAWPKWRHDLGYVDDTVVVLVALLVVWVIVQRVRALRATRSPV